MAQTQARRSEPADPQLLALKVPPHSVEAEQSLIGGLLLDNSAFDRIADMVTAEDFYRDDHRRLYRQITKLIEHGKPADTLTVAESLERSGKLGEIGGHAYLASLSLNTPSAANIRRYAEIVRERSVMRRLAAVGDLARARGRTRLLVGQRLQSRLAHVVHHEFVARADEVICHRQPHVPDADETDWHVPLLDLMFLACAYW